jgi:hypothetical protein
MSAASLSLRDLKSSPDRGDPASILFRVDGKLSSVQHAFESRVDRERELLQNELSSYSAMGSRAYLFRQHPCCLIFAAHFRSRLLHCMSRSVITRLALTLTHFVCCCVRSIALMISLCL